MGAPAAVVMPQIDIPTFAAKLKSNPSAFEKICRIALLALGTFANSVNPAVAAAKNVLTLTGSTINTIQAFQPLSYFVNEKYKQHTSANHIFNASSLYLGLCDMAGWIQTNAKALALFAQSVTATVPLLGRVSLAGAVKFATPAAVVLFASHAYIHGVKCMNAANQVEKNKSLIQVAWSVGNIALIAFALTAISTPLLVGSAVAFEAAVHTVGLLGDGYDIYNP